MELKYNLKYDKIIDKIYCFTVKYKVILKAKEEL